MTTVRAHTEHTDDTTPVPWSCSLPDKVESFCGNFTKGDWFCNNTFCPTCLHAFECDTTCGHCTVVTATSTTTSTTTTSTTTITATTETSTTTLTATTTITTT